MSRNDVIARAAEIPLQVADAFLFHFVVTLLLQWKNATRSCPVLLLDFHAEEVLHTFPKTISHNNQAYIAFLLVKKNNFQIINHCGLKKMFQIGLQAKH